MAETQPGVWGIDLGQCGLKAIRLERVDGEITATAFDYIEHPKILSQPDADPDQLTREALEKFLSRNTLRGDTVVISVPGQSGLARFVKLPPVEEKKISDIVRFEAKQQIPFPLEEVVWDFQKLGSGVVTDGYALETEIGLFAMKRDMVNRYLQHFKDVNVEVHIVQMAPLALCNFVSYDLLDKGTGETSSAQGEDEEDEGKKNCVVALDIGTDSSNLVITDGERIIWQRPIPLGGNHFTRALTKDLKLTFAKAEHTKRNAAKLPDLKKILLALKPVLNDFVGEVQRSLGYFTNTHRDANISYLVGLGNAFRLPGLQKFLQEKLQLEVRKLQKLRRVSGESVVTAPQFTDNVLSFAVAYGLALQGLKLTRLHTNLLPQEIQRERLVRAKKPWAAAAAAALLMAAGSMALGLGMVYSAVHNKNVDKAKSEAKATIDRGKGIQSQLIAKEDEGKKSDEAVKRIGAGVDERFNWNLLYKYIHDALPMPDGGHLAKDTRFSAHPWNDYFKVGISNKKERPYPGEQAFRDFQERRRAIAAGRPPRADDDKLDAEIKKSLVQINIEGIDSLYVDDLGPFWDNLKNHQLWGMSEKDKQDIKKNAKDGLPKKGWLVEIRAFTQHRDRERFALNTLVENLADPERAKITLSPEMEKQIRKGISHVLMYKFDKVDDPQPGVLQMINVSYLREALGSSPLGIAGGRGDRPSVVEPTGSKDPTKPAAAAPDTWRPLGDIAGATFASAPGAAFGLGAPGQRDRPLAATLAPAPKTGVVPPGTSPSEAGSTPSSQVRVPRTEFVIFFVWQEPLPPDQQAAPTP
jgi:type IV pilus assembly protein PilM